MRPYRAVQRMIDYMHLLQRRKKAYISQVKISVITANNSRCPLYLRSVASSSSSFIGTVSICTVFNLLGCYFMRCSPISNSFISWLNSKFVLVVIENPTTIQMCSYTTLWFLWSLMFQIVARFLTLIFHKVVWQHVWGVMGSLTFLQIYCRV